MNEIIKIPTTLGHKVSATDKHTFPFGTERTTEYQRWAISFSVSSEKFRDIVEAKCEYCGRNLKFKVIMPRYYRLMRKIWLSIMIPILGILLYFKYPYIKSMIIFGIIPVFIIIRLLLWRNPEPCVTWADNENRDQMHVIF